MLVARDGGMERCQSGAMSGGWAEYCTGWSNVRMNIVQDRAMSGRQLKVVQE